MQAGREGEGSGIRGQPPLQAGLWRQNWESAGGGGAVEEAQVKSESTRKNECGRWVNAWLDACLVSRFYLERQLKKEREQRSASRQVVIPQKEPRPTESSPKVRSNKRKLLLWSQFSVTEYISPTVYSRRPVGQKGEQPVNHRSRGQIQSQLQPVCSFEKFHLKSNLTVLFFPICHFYVFAPPFKVPLASRGWRGELEAQL